MAAHSFSILARKDERELRFLLNFVDAKQQQHLFQVQPFFVASSVDSAGKEMGSNRSTEVFFTGSVQNYVGRPFIRRMTYKLASFSILLSSQSE